MYRIYSTVIVILLCCAAAVAQPSKREFRAAWIATVANIDWPSKPGLPAIEQQEQFVRRLDQLKDAGCNAVIVQIRPSADAFYASTLEPWSHYLTGRQGQPPFPYYDPLVFMITEAHKRNMEFHAWFNPFRALVDSHKNPNPADHVTHTHPEWIISYGGKSYIDPGFYQAREYVVSVIADVVKRYDIDAVHLDDYFYPYRIAGQQFGDYRSYALYGQGADREDWRRGNVSQFITLLNTTIKQIKPFVKLGISPFGVWRNASKDPIEGSATRGGQTDYDDLYADVVLWMKKGWIDYLLPQLYWEHGNRAAPFQVLMPWWQQHSYGRQVYFGLGLYRMVGGRGMWAGDREIMSQVDDIRNMEPQTGYALYSASILDKVPAIKADLRNFNKYPAMPPRMKWLDSIAPMPPYLKAIPSVEGTLLQWQVTNPSKEPLRYVVYRFIDNEAINLERADRIMSIQSIPDYLDLDANKHKKVTYVVTAVDRLWNESRGSNAESTMVNQ